MFQVRAARAISHGWTRIRAWSKLVLASYHFAAVVTGGNVATQQSGRPAFRPQHERKNLCAGSMRSRFGSGLIMIAIGLAWLIFALATYRTFKNSGINVYHSNKMT